MSTVEQLSGFREDVCTLFHGKVGEPPCWTNVYNREGLEAGRLSMSMLPPGEDVAPEEANIQQPGIV